MADHSKKAVALLLSLFSFGVLAQDDCEFHWDYESSMDGYIEGFRFYESYVLIYTLQSPADRSTACSVIGVPLGSTGDITMTAFRGNRESLHSNPATLPRPDNFRSLNLN